METMNPEQQRIAIAEASGWVREYSDVPTWDTSLNSYKPVHTMLFRRKEKCFRAENLPDYLNDLNAMHEAEKVLTPLQFETFRWILWDLCKSPQVTEWNRAYLSATAAQRAEAFLRTLNLWKP